uniref:Carboxylic ester hydrolase n=1 Tax=Holotrichia parallela TaxID=93412 RepID=A0A6G7SJJ8_HOLPA|nr:carboxylesterase 1 [Holotrichia parallela]
MYYQLIIASCIFTILYSISIIECQEVLVEISQGILKGKTATNRDGGTFYSFQSIPYGQPPINELRFKAPVAAHGWDGVRDATSDVPSCWQAMGAMLYGQEDCLYLNVYTPELPDEDSALKPVMVWIHGGGFVSGSAQTFIFGPEFLLTKDIVLVALNYRLGLLGFFDLDHPELGVPGNAGLKDQVLALQWVQDNIARFGGDPHEVTIFGESAGAMSVHLHMLSPMSVGLFQKAIAQSGVALSIIFVNRTKNNGEMVAQQLGIQTENWSDMLTSLQQADVQDLIMATQILSIEDDLFATPIVEEPSNVPVFLPSRPIDIIKSGNYRQIQFLTGITDAEGLLAQQASLEATGENLLIEDFTYFVPREFEIAPGSEEEAIVSQKIKEFYYGDTEPTRQDIAPAVDLYTDFVFGFPAYRAILEHLQTSTAEMYFYIFSAETDLNFAKQIEPRLQEFPGAAHGDELGYLFQNVFTPATIEAGGVEDLAWRNMVTLWTNFVSRGNPTPDDYNGFVWQPVSENTFNFLHIGTNVTYSDINPNPKNMQFWYDLYEEYYSNNS